MVWCLGDSMAMESLGLVGCLYIEIELLAVLEHESVQALRKRKNKSRSKIRVKTVKIGKF